jgi:hypothetical protein
MVEAHPEQLAERAADGLLDELAKLARPWLVRVFRMVFGASDQDDERAEASDLRVDEWARRALSSQRGRRSRTPHKA